MQDYCLEDIKIFLISKGEVDNRKVIIYLEEIGKINYFLNNVKFYQ